MLYIDRTLDNLHRYKHNNKTLIALKLLGDKEKDSMYEDDNRTKNMTTKQRQEYLRETYKLQEYFGVQINTSKQ